MYYIIMLIYITVLVLLPCSIPCIIIFSIKATKRRNRENFIRKFGYSPEAVKQVKEFKKLLDNGIITQEEFEYKKRELLDL